MGLLEGQGYVSAVSEPELVAVDYAVAVVNRIEADNVFLSENLKNVATDIEFDKHELGSEKVITDGVELG